MIIMNYAECPERVCTHVGAHHSKMSARGGARSAVRPRRMAARARRRHARHRAALKAPPRSPVFRRGRARAACCLRCACPLSSTRGAAHDRRVGGARGRLSVQRRLGVDMRRNHAESARREPRAGAVETVSPRCRHCVDSSKFGLNKVLKRKHSTLIGWIYRSTVQSQRKRSPRPRASGGRKLPRD